MTTSSLCLFLALPQAIAGQSVAAGPALEPATRDAAHWVARSGGGGADWWVDATPALGGGVFAAGYTFSFGAGASDGWVLASDPMGRARFELALGGAGADELRAVAAAPGGGCVLAGATGSSGAGGLDGWLVKLAADGALEWQRTYGTAGDEVFSAVALVPGSEAAPRYYVGGTGAFGTTGRDAWVLEVDAAGTVLWQRTLGGEGDDDLSALAATPDGLAFAAASQSSFGGPPAGFTRPWLVRLDATGAPVAQRAIDVSGGDLIDDLVALPDGTFAATGEVLAFAFFRGDVWVLRLDAGLGVIWDRRFGDSFGPGFDGGRSVRALPDGDLLVAGSTATAGAGSEDLWLLRLDGEGNLLADRTIGAAGFDAGYALALDPAGLAYVAGIVQLPPSGGSLDGFLARLTADTFVTAGSGCPAVLPTQPNVWTGPATVFATDAVPATPATATAPASTAVTPLATLRRLCP